jgi:hypothetical protein
MRVRSFTEESIAEQLSTNSALTENAHALFGLCPRTALDQPDHPLILLPTGLPAPSWLSLSYSIPLLRSITREALDDPDRELIASLGSSECPVHMLSIIITLARDPGDPEVHRLWNIAPSGEMH